MISCLPYWLTKGKKSKPRVRVGSGNVFADLGLKDAEELLVKAGLVLEITKAIKRLGLKQVDAASLLGVDQPKISRLIRGDLYGFSTDQLMRFLSALGRDVEIVVRPRRSKKQPRGRITIQAA